MSNAMIRSHSGDGFYNPPAMRRQHHYWLLQQQQLLQKQAQRSLHRETRPDPEEVETRNDSDDSTLSRPNSARSISPPKSTTLTNLDRLIESVTPFVPARYKMASRKVREIDAHPYFYLGDLWESFNEWSVYGAGVPLLLSCGDSVDQYYVPSLSGMQLYVDSQALRQHGENSNAFTSKETNSAGSSDSEAERQTKIGADGVWGQHNLFNLNSQRLHELTLRDKPPKSSSSDEPELRHTPDLLYFEYLERELPHHRKPLYDTVSNLASKFPDIKLYRSCDLLPSSWICVAWYPIYRIPTGPTLQNVDACFLTFHSLSTHSRSTNQVRVDSPSGRKARGAAASPKISLPVFGLASYKLRGSIVNQNGAQEWEQSNSLLQTAQSWLRRLNAGLDSAGEHLCSSPEETPPTGKVRTKRRRKCRCVVIYTR